MAVQIARVLGATVTVVTRTKEKQAEAEQLGAHEELISTDSKTMEAHELKFNFILTTVPDAFEGNDYMKLAFPTILNDYVRPGLVKVDFRGLGVVTRASEPALRYVLAV